MIPRSSQKQSESAFEELTAPRWKGKAVWTVAEATAAEIDSTNILQASLKAMSDAVRALEIRPHCVLVDGCNRPPDLLRKGEQWTRGSKADERTKADEKQTKLSSFFAPRQVTAPADAPWRPRRVDAVINGDAQVVCISAASIIAKVHRDRIMAELHATHPQYGFADHKGYATASHLEAISKHGPCPAHRRSFAPVRDALSIEGLSTPAGLKNAKTAAIGLAPMQTDTPEKLPAASKRVPSAAAEVKKGKRSRKQLEGPAAALAAGTRRRIEDLGATENSVHATEFSAPVGGFGAQLEFLGEGTPNFKVHE